MPTAAKTSTFDSVVLITGAGRGIGAATARRFAAPGRTIILASRTRAELEGLARELKASGATAQVEVCDLADPAACAALIHSAEATCGGIDILINNAGLCRPQPLIEMSDADFQAHIDVNLGAIFRLCRAALPKMLARKRGCIVNVASISGIRGTSKFPGFTAYAAAKAGVIVLTEALAAEVAGQGVRVNCVSPGAVDTAMLRRVAPGVEPSMTPAEVAESIHHLCSPASRPINGRNLEVYG